MISFLLSIFRSFFISFRDKPAFLCQIAIQKKEIEILRRQNKDKRPQFNINDRRYFLLWNKVSAVKEYLTIIRPETLLKWQRLVIASFWHRKHRIVHNGRPPVSADIRALILAMKNDNPLWGVKKIQGELMKVNIQLDTKTIWNIIMHFRRTGKIKKSLTWKRFLLAQINSIYAMDFFTVDSIRNQRFYVHFIIAHKTREIIRFAITENPTKEFVRQQLVEYYNSQRPHQGIGQKIPIPPIVVGKGSIKKINVLGGLRHHYYREAA